MGGRRMSPFWNHRRCISLATGALALAAVTTWAFLGFWKNLKP